MDKTDNYIMHELLNDAQIPFRRIALKFGISPETVRKRYERLRKEGIINQCMISVNFEKIMFEGFILLMITSKEIAETMVYLKKMKNIICVIKTTGDFDILVMAVSKDIADLLRLVEGVKILPNVEQVEIFIRTLDAPFPASLIAPGMASLLRKNNANSTQD